MDIAYQITDTTLNHVSQFTQILDRLSFFSHASFWKPRLQEVSLRKQAFGAVAIGLNLIDTPTEINNLYQIETSLPPQALTEFQQYLEAVKTLQTLSPGRKDLSLDDIEQLHALVSNRKFVPGQLSFRTTHGRVSKVIWEHGIKKIIDFEVETKGEHVISRMEDFVAWYNRYREAVNPVVLAAIAHLKIAEIHPYADANGRLSRLVAKYALLTHDYPDFLLVPVEYFHYIHREAYYDMISKTIESQDMTEWLEFYSKAILSSVHMAGHDLYALSGGSIDLLEKKIVELTDREVEVLELLTQRQQASAAEIGATLQVSRQNANVILKRLVTKGLLKVIGKSTSSRYALLV